MKCPTCLKYSKQQQREPLHPHTVPSFPWQKLGCDLFDYKQSAYLLVADYYSKFPVIRKLTSTTSSSIINHLKSIFAEHGIPQTLVSDNGPQYSSREFETFCDQWNINHVTTSPLYPKSNGFIERMVQTTKNILKKSDDAGDDPYLGVLAYRATPVDKELPAPATLLNQRTYRTLLPCSGRLQCMKSSDDNLKRLEKVKISKRNSTTRQQVVVLAIWRASNTWHCTTRKSKYGHPHKLKAKLKNRGHTW